ncbi:MAG: type I glyceraldehyde-3-phosphate dehydrogenase [Nitrososphaerota archaeon]
MHNFFRPLYIPPYVAAIRVGINGMGRIGRLFLRAALQDPGYDILFKVVAVNDIAGAKHVAHLLKYDSVHGRLGMSLEVGENTIKIDTYNIRCYSVPNPVEIPWDEVGVDLVIEATGYFTKRRDAAAHLNHGVRHVIVSAPSPDADITIVPGVNDGALDPSRHAVISGASCTTNCLAPVVKVLMDSFGIVKGYMTTIHALTNDQRLLDLYHKDFRRARAATQSIIPTSTGAAAALHLVIPEAKGKLHGVAMRVPVMDGSLTDLTALLPKPVTVREVNEVFQEESMGRMKGIIEYNEDPIVSVDVIGNPHSCIFDATQTLVLNEKSDLVKVFGWYDNEWGYCNRLVDLVRLVKGVGRRRWETLPHT